MEAFARSSACHEAARRAQNQVMNQPSRPWWPRIVAWLPPLAHPLVLGGLGLLAVRAAGLWWHYFGGDLNGRPLVAMPRGSFIIALAYHGAVLLTLVVAWLLAWLLLPRWRRAVVWLAVPGFGLPLLLGQVDFEMIRLVGRQFSPSVLNTYGSTAVTFEVLLPLRADLAHTIGSLALILGGWLWLALVAWRAGRAPAVTGRSWLWMVLLPGAILCMALIPADSPPISRVTFQPPEITFLEAWSGANATRPPADPIALVRRVLMPAEDRAWTGDKFPLVHTPPGPAGPVDDPPDIIVVAIESLRARHLGYINPAQADVTPQFDRLARASVVFPRYISNGYPSAPGFFSLHTGTLPHRNRTITAELTSIVFDALPARLKAQGYHRLAIWGGNVNMGNQFAWARQWYDEVDYAIAGNENGFYYSRGDAETFRVLKEHISQADQTAPGRPQFIFVATAGTHGPFTTANAVFHDPADEAEAAPFNTFPDKDRADNYDHMLRLLDRQIGLFVDFLARRPRARNTVLIVCGDHSVSVTERVQYGIHDFPMDGAVWTSAVIHGPERLVGPPRTVDFSASSVDLMPTILALAGDRRPTAAMGADLFAPLPPEQRFAVAVREDGYRLDRNGWSLFVNAVDPSDYFVHRSFQDLERTKVSDPGSPFTAQDARDLHAAMQGWSWFIEQNRVWSGQPATP